jgi:hypothetical protein
MIADIKRVSQVFGGFKSGDIYGYHKLSATFKEG